MITVVDIRRNGIHGSRAVKGHGCDNIFDTVRAELFHKVLKAARFDLEDRLGVSRGNEVVYFGIVVGALVKIDDRAVVFLDVFHAHFNIGQVSQSQKVHFQEAEMFQFHAGVLAGDIIAVPRKRHVPVQNIVTDDNAAGVRAGLAGHIFQIHRDVHHAADIVVVLIHIDQFGNRIIDAVVLRPLFRVVEAERLHQDIGAL